MVASPTRLRLPDDAFLFQSPSLRGSGRFRAGGSWWLTSRGVSIPFIAGQWSLPTWIWFVLRHWIVSIPFIAGQWSLRRSDLGSYLTFGGFNPLHCGAVVASKGLRDFSRSKSDVSIPFIAGQWSLLEGWQGLPLRYHVSIPFIAGQWSLRIRGAGVYQGLLLFQSPSLRGSGRFS